MILKRAKLADGDRFQDNQDIDLRSNRHGEYIDDFFSIGRNQESIRADLTRVLTECKRAGLPAKPTKVTFPGQKEERILGLIFTANGEIRPEIAKIRQTIASTRKLIQGRVWNLKTIQSILGSWAWIFLLRRPLSFLFSAAFMNLSK